MVHCSIGGFGVVVLLYPTWFYGDFISSFSSYASSSSCSNTSCVALAAEYPDCNGTLSWISDGYCDVDNNILSCGYDGGDCCVCTCVNGPDYDCGSNGFSRIEPDEATAKKYGCVEISLPVLPCSIETPRHWVVDDTASAQALAEAVNCSGGVFEVEWVGHVIVDWTFYVIDGTVLTIAGDGSSVSVQGNSNTGLFTIANASLHVIGLNISNSGGASGVVAVAGSSVVFNRTSFIGNSAVGDGGALYVSHGSSVSFVGDTYFSDNSATGNGGAVFVSEQSSVSFASEISYAYENSRSSVGIMDVVAISGASWSGKTSFLNNTAGEDGGALYVSWNSSVTWAEETIFEGNFADSQDRRGGGLYTIYDCNVSWSGNTSFINNIADLDGGAFYVGGGSTVSWSEHTSFLNNFARYGGAGYVREASVSWNGNTSFISNSVHFAGGGLHATGQSDVSWDGDAVWIDNSAETGGAVYLIDASSVSWSGNTSFVSNTAVFTGGAVGSIAYGEESLLTIKGPTTFVNNTSDVNGGGVALLGALNVAIEEPDISFVGNYAANAGGGLYLSGTGIGPVFSNVSFISNVVQLGGAVFAAGSGNELRGDDDQKPTTFNGCRFVANKAMATGGAIDTASGRDIISNTLFMGNTAGVGGALRLAGTAFISNCSFVENISDKDGGAAVSNIGVVDLMENNSFTGNIYNCEPGTFLDYSESVDIFDKACDGCDGNCTGCSYDEPPLAPLCMEVMEHATSPGGTITLDLLRIESGYWRASNLSVEILACYDVDACLGGVTGMSNYCRQGHEGPYCSICSDGYVANLGFSCNQCADNEGGIVLAVVLAVIALIVAIFTISYLLSGKMEDAGTGFVDRARRSLPLQSIKIVVVVWQIVTQFTTVANVTYPGVYQRFLDKVDVLNFDLGWMISAGCIVDVDFHDQLLISTLGPIIVMLFLGATYAVALRLHIGSEDALQVVRYKHASMALLLTFLVYSSVSSVLFQMYGCDKLDDGKNYLRADYRIECDSSKHETLQVYAGFMIALYTIGIPALYTGLLLRSRDVLKDNSGRENNLRAQLTSNIWKPYKPTRFYYEIIECARRMLLAGVVVFIYPNTAAQIAVTLTMAMVFVFVSEGLAPYELRWDCWVNRMGHAIVLTSLYLALLLKVDVSEERASSQKVFEAVLVSAHAFMALTVVVEAAMMACERHGHTLKETGPKPRSGCKWNGKGSLQEVDVQSSTHA